MSTRGLPRVAGPSRPWARRMPAVAGLGRAESLALLTGIPVLLAIAVVAAAVPHPGVWIPLIAIATACCVLVGVSWALHRDPFAPLGVVAVMLLVLYVLRPAYILDVGVWGPAARVDDRVLTPELHDAMARSLWIVFAGIVAMGAAHLVAHRHLGGRTGGLDGFAKGLQGHDAGALSPPRVAAAAGGGLLLVVTGFGLLVAEAGGIAAYAESLSNRSEVFAGRAFLASSALPLKAVVLVSAAFLLSRGALRARTRLLLAAGVLLVCVGDLLSGGRAALILFTLLPLILLFHYLRRPLRAPAVVAVLAALLVLFVTVRVVLRDSVYQDTGQSRVERVAQAFQDLPRTTVGGREAIPFDSLLRLEEARGDGALPTRWGGTYLAVAAFPVPRAVWADKPTGGNVWFTRTYYPRFYGREQVTTSVSLAGEGLANFGVAGVLAAFAALGAALAWAYARLRAATSVLTVVVYCATIGYAFTIVRGDAYHSLSGFAMTAVVVGVAGLFMTGRGLPSLASRRR